MVSECARSRPSRPSTRRSTLGAELGAHLELLARRQGQLRGGPHRRRPDRPRLPGGRQGGPVRAGLPRSRGHLPGRRGRDPAVPGHRVRVAGRGQRARGGAPGRRGLPGGLRRQRPDGVVARPGAPARPGRPAAARRRSRHHPARGRAVDGLGVPRPAPPGGRRAVQRARAPADPGAGLLGRAAADGAAARRQPPGRRRQHERDRLRGHHRGRTLWNETGSATYQLRSPAEIARLFDGLELLEPGVVSCPHWRPQILTPDPVDEFCGVGRKN